MKKIERSSYIGNNIPTELQDVQHVSPQNETQQQTIQTLIVPVNEQTPILPHHPHPALQQKIQQDVEPAIVSEQNFQYVQSNSVQSDTLPRFFPLQGNKIALLQHKQDDILRKLLLAIARSPDFLCYMELFAGAVTPAIWLAQANELPEHVELLLNELTPYRNEVLYQVLEAKKGSVMLDEYNQLCNEMSQLCYKTLHLAQMEKPTFEDVAQISDVDAGTLKDWEDTHIFDHAEKQKCKPILKSFIARQLGEGWPDTSRSPLRLPKNAARYLIVAENVGREGTPPDIRPLKTTAGNASKDAKLTGLRQPGFTPHILGHFSEKKSPNTKMSLRKRQAETNQNIYVLSNLFPAKQPIRVIQHNGWLVPKKENAQKGTLLLIDPIYVLKDGQDPHQITYYIHGGDFPELSPDGALRLFRDHLLEPWGKGAWIIYFNHDNDKLRGSLGNWGLNVTRTLTTSEIIVSNFDIDANGFPVVREFGVGMPEYPLTTAGEDLYLTPWKDPLFSVLYRKVDESDIDANQIGASMTKIFSYNDEIEHDDPMSDVEQGGVDDQIDPMEQSNRKSVSAWSAALAAHSMDEDVSNDCLTLADEFVDYIADPEVSPDPLPGEGLARVRNLSYLAQTDSVRFEEEIRDFLEYRESEDEDRDLLYLTHYRDFLRTGQAQPPQVAGPSISNAHQSVGAHTLTHSHQSMPPQITQQSSMQQPFSQVQPSQSVAMRQTFGPVKNKNYIDDYFIQYGIKGSTHNRKVLNAFVREIENEFIGDLKAIVNRPENTARIDQILSSSKIQNMAVSGFAKDFLGHLRYPVSNANYAYIKLYLSHFVTTQLSQDGNTLRALVHQIETQFPGQDLKTVLSQQQNIAMVQTILALPEMQALPDHPNLSVFLMLVANGSANANNTQSSLSWGQAMSQYHQNNSNAVSAEKIQAMYQIATDFGNEIVADVRNLVQNGTYDFAVTRYLDHYKEVGLSRIEKIEALNHYKIFLSTNQVNFSQ